MMKAIKILSLILMVVCLYACKKDKAEPTNVMPDITGTWEMRQSFGPTAGSLVNYSPGKGSTYKFNSNGSFALYAVTGTLVDQGTYKINRANMFGVEGDELLLTNTTVQEGTYSVTLQGDTTLKLTLNDVDLVYGIYARIK